MGIYKTDVASTGKAKCNLDKAIHVSLYKHDEMLATYTVHARLFILCNTLNCLGFFKQMYFWSQENVKFHHRNLARGGFDW